MEGEDIGGLAVFGEGEGFGLLVAEGGDGAGLLMEEGFGDIGPGEVAQGGALGEETPARHCPSSLWFFSEQLSVLVGLIEWVVVRTVIEWGAFLS